MLTGSNLQKNKFMCRAPRIPVLNPVIEKNEK